jgi:hypothetical protein
VEWVFGLTGGELESKPLRYAYKWTEMEYRPNERDHFPIVTKLRRKWARYWYEGASEYMELGRQRYRGSYTTLVWDSGSYGDHLPPRTIVVKGERWRKVASFASSGEAACPVPKYHPGKVTRADAKLGQANPCASSRSYRPKARHAHCLLCGERLGGEHGYLYLGEGWMEVVYYKPDPKDEE